MVIGIDFRSGVPIPRQIADAIIIRALTGGLAPGSTLPDVRELSLQLQVNPNLVEQAYLILQDAGVATDSDSGWSISGRLPPAQAGFEPLERSMTAIVERGLSIGLSREQLRDIFHRALEDSDGSH